MLSMSIKLLRPFIDFALLGEAGEDSLAINWFAFDAFIKKLGNSKWFKDDKKSGGMERRLALLERSGLKIAYSGDNAVLTNALFPNMFTAMCKMAKLVFLSCKGERSGDCAVAVNSGGIKLCEHWWKALMWGTQDRVSMEELPYIDKILDKVMLYI